MSLDHEVSGCLICKILAKRLGAHQEEGAYSSGTYIIVILC